jgi:hypothetical protein
MWELYVQRVEGTNVKAPCEFNNDPIKNMFWMSNKNQGWLSNIKKNWLTN